MRFCFCIFDSDTVKSDCPMQDLKIFYRLLVSFTSLTNCSGDITKALKMKKSSENDQSTGHFQSFFSFLIASQTLILKDNHVKQLIKNGLIPFHTFTSLLSRLIRPSKGISELGKGIYSGEHEKTKTIVDPWYQK